MVNEVTNNALFNNFINKHKDYQNKNSSQNPAPKKPSMVHPHHHKQTKDPLMQYPLRLAAYTNEVGVAIETVPGLGLLSKLLWVPALMYFGADIYDKYKRGRNNDYQDPSGTMGLKQTCFQALASVILPTIAVKAGQEAAGMAAKFNGSKLNAGAQEDILKAIYKALSEGTFNDRSKEDVFRVIRKDFNSTLNELEIDRDSEKLWGKIVRFFKHGEEPHASVKSNRTHVLSDLKKKVDEIYDIRKNLIGKDFDKVRKKTGQKFINLFNVSYNNFKAHGKEPKPALTAANQIVRKFIETKKLRFNLLKTAGGFAALALFAIPIDRFVEKIIMQGFLSPSIDQVSIKVKEINKSLMFKSNHSEKSSQD